MINIEHADMVRSLVKPGQHIMIWLEDDSVDLWHAATGLVGEVGELVECVNSDPFDLENFIEELGDIEFYLCQARQNLEIDRDFIVNMGYHAKPMLPMTGLMIAACGFLDQVKKTVIYNKPTDRTECIKALADIERRLEEIRAVRLVDRSETLRANIDKLSQRYPNASYSDEHAQARLDKTG